MSFLKYLVKSQIVSVWGGRLKGQGHNKMSPDSPIRKLVVKGIEELVG